MQGGNIPISCRRRVKDKNISTISYIEQVPAFVQRDIGWSSKSCSTAGNCPGRCHVPILGADVVKNQDGNVVSVCYVQPVSRCIQGEKCGAQERGSNSANGSCWNNVTARSERIIKPQNRVCS